MAEMLRPARDSLQDHYLFGLVFGYLKSQEAPEIIVEAVRRLASDAGVNLIPAEKKGG